MNTSPIRTGELRPKLIISHFTMCPWKGRISSFSLLNAGQILSSLKSPIWSMRVQVATMGWNSRLKILQPVILCPVHHFPFQSKYKGSDGIERNTTFNNEYVINALFGKEWKINNKWMLTTDMKFTAAGGRYVTPIDLAASQLAGKEVLQQDKAFTEKLSPYLRMDLKIGVRTNRKGWSQYFAMDFQNLTNHQNVFFEAIQCHCRSHRYSIPNWIFS